MQWGKVGSHEGMEKTRFLRLQGYSQFLCRMEKLRELSQAALPATSHPESFTAMALNSTKRKFEAYLLKPLDRRFDEKGIVPSKITEDEARELIFQQSLLLKVAQETQSANPWAAYFAIIKHTLIMDDNRITTATFAAMRDKEFAQEVAAMAETIRETTAMNLDKETIENLEYLCKLQTAGIHAASARTTLSSIAAFGHHDALMAAARGLKLFNGRMTMLAGLLIGTVLVFYFGKNAGAVAVILLATLLISACLAYPQYARWKAVTAFLASFKKEIVPAARSLDADPFEWLDTPTQAQIFLGEAETTRKQFEQSYLQWSSQG